jgi:16S rRNA (cytosine967-C5)-methyltransferase
MNNQGNIVALDVDTEKLNQLEAQMARLGVSIVTTRRHDLENAVDARKDQSFDRILLDAPCTGLGVLRRNPDAKWDRSKKDLERLARRQIKFLVSLKRLLKVSGILVYAVCSVEPEENEAVIDAFLSKCPGFEVDPDPGKLPRRIYARFENETGFKTHPFFKAMDGFYMVRLKRIR